MNSEQKNQGPARQSRASDSPLARFADHQGNIILDGGLATALEDLGHDLNDSLWSAKILIEAPEAIRDLHETYLRAGADCISCATYQASISGFMERGLSEEQSVDLMRRAVQLACEARDNFWADQNNRKGRLYPLVAASIGPYGAFLADGSEYRGGYVVSKSELVDFHLSRWKIMVSSEADLLACETIPSGPEAEVLLGLLGETDNCWGWLSFSCRDGSHLCDGTPLQEVVKLCDQEASIAAIGINCTAPEHVGSLVAQARAVTDKMILVYPNLGELYDATAKTWGLGPSTENWLELAGQWVSAGANGVGGCCRIGPDMISRLRKELLA